MTITVLFAQEDHPNPTSGKLVHLQVGAHAASEGAERSQRADERKRDEIRQSRTFPLRGEETFQNDAEEPGSVVGGKARARAEESDRLEQSLETAGKVGASLRVDSFEGHLMGEQGSQRQGGREGRVLGQEKTLSASPSCSCSHLSRTTDPSSASKMHASDQSATMLLAQQTDSMIESPMAAGSAGSSRSMSKKHDSTALLSHCCECAWLLSPPLSAASSSGGGWQL